ncbi:tumor necrosis factor receptor superfamily member 27 [Microcaecilia unicolor]|uniref:Tumor necrosis factor receptor superfamily member 27 n=1 Tax=Microcaecilia unicolor TaxID=1415580 RepID=A0A6P7YT64_9AMPH|nr:tumor necrosis factor receptor superfamily member 27 [Microcaecilia unicolor]
MGRKGFSPLLLLSLTELCCGLANPLECQENQYWDDQGRCVPCKECGPGQELSKECGYGEGGDGQCMACQVHRFKNDWGHHRCKTCLSCALINRVQKSNCTAVANAVCGTCLPGFYSKTRIGGLQDQECIPCTQQTPITESQCMSRVRQLKPVTPSLPSHDSTILAVVIGMALGLILLALGILSILYCRRFLKRQVQQAFQRSEDEAVQTVLFTTRPPCDPQHPSSASDADICQHVRGPVEEMQPVTTSCIGPCGLPCPLQPDLSCAPIPLPATEPQLIRSLSETQPLLRNSGCSDCSMSSDARQSPVGCVMPSPQNPVASPCAPEPQRQQHWAHFPVECTELDLQQFSTEMGFTDTKDQEWSRNQGTRTMLGDGTLLRREAPVDCVCTASLQKAHVSEVPEAACHESCPGFQPVVLQNEVNEVQSQVFRIGHMTHGLHVAEIPPAMVLLLGLKLDPFLHGVKNFMDVGVDLGIPTEQLRHMTGFRHLHTYLSCSSPCTIPTLLQTLYKLQRWDALSLLCDHLTQNWVHSCRERH